MDLSDAVNDPDMAESFTVLRRAGTFQAGGWVPGTPTSVPFYGVVSIASGTDLEAIPEGDRIRGAIVVHSTQEMFTTDAAISGMSDLIVWQGDQYRVYDVSNYSNRVFWKAIAAKIIGNS